MCVVAGRSRWTNPDDASYLMHSRSHHYPFFLLWLFSRSSTGSQHGQSCLIWISLVLRHGTSSTLLPRYFLLDGLLLLARGRRAQLLRWDLENTGGGRERCQVLSGNSGKGKSSVVYACMACMYMLLFAYFFVLVYGLMYDLHLFLSLYSSVYVSLCVEGERVCLIYLE